VDGRNWRLVALRGCGGSPDDPAELAALLAYSPYHNISADKTYPPVLVASSDADARVDPMHARKAFLWHPTK
jgi:prolyl oligopeptidase PreP (S9A serine peptidase family)